MKRLHHEIMKLQSEAGQEEQDSMGVHVTPSGDGDDLYRWDIKISKWDDSTSLGRSCKKNKVDEVHFFFKVKFAIDMQKLTIQNINKSSPLSFRSSVSIR